MRRWTDPPGADRFYDEARRLETLLRANGHAEHADSVGRALSAPLPSERAVAVEASLLRVTERLLDVDPKITQHARALLMTLDETLRPQR